MTNTTIKQVTFLPQQDPYLPQGYTVRSDTESSSSEDLFSQPGHDDDDSADSPKHIPKPSFIHRLKTRVMMRPGYNRGKSKELDREKANDKDSPRGVNNLNGETSKTPGDVTDAVLLQSDRDTKEVTRLNDRMEANIREVLEENGNKTIELLNLIKDKEDEDESFGIAKYVDGEKSSTDEHSFQMEDSMPFFKCVPSGKPQVSLSPITPTDNMENINKFDIQERTSPMKNIGTSNINSNTTVEKKENGNSYAIFSKIFGFLNRELSPQTSLETIGEYILETLVCFVEREDLLNNQRKKLTQTLQDSRKKVQSLEQEYKHKLDQCGGKLCKVTSELNALREKMGDMSEETRILKKNLGYYQKLLERLEISFDPEGNLDDQFEGAVLTYEQAAQSRQEQKLLNKKLETLASRWRLSAKKLAEENRKKSETIDEYRANLTSLNDKNSAIKQQLAANFDTMKALEVKREEQSRTIVELKRKDIQSNSDLKTERERVNELRKTTSRLGHNLQLLESLRVYSLEFMSELALGFEDSLSNEVVEEYRHYLKLLSGVHLLPPNIDGNAYDGSASIENESRSVENNIKVFYTELATHGVLNRIVDEYRQCIQGNHLYFKRLQEFKQKCTKQTEIIAKLNEHLKLHSHGCLDRKREYALRADIHGN